MTIELYSLTILALLSFLGWLPTSIAKRRTFGRSYLLSNREQNQPHWPPEKLPEWSHRAERAFENLKGYFPAYVVSILVLDRLQLHDLSIEIAAAAFCFSRYLHYIFYILGNVTGRATAWASACLFNIYLLFRILIFTL